MLINDLLTYAWQYCGRILEKIQQIEAENSKYATKNQTGVSKFRKTRVPTFYFMIEEKIILDRYSKQNSLEILRLPHS